MTFFRWLFYFFKELITITIFLLISTMLLKEVTGYSSYQDIFLLITFLFLFDLISSYLYHKIDLIFKIKVDNYNTEDYSEILKSINTKKYTPFPIKVFRLKSETHHNAYARFGTIIIEGSEHESHEEKKFTIGHELAHIVNNHWMLIHLSKRMDQLTSIVLIILKFTFMPFLFFKNIFLRIILGTVFILYFYITSASISIDNLISILSLQALNILLFKYLIREKEFEADIFAKLIVGNKGGISFFEKLKEQTSKLNNILEFVKEPISTHPKLKKRIDNLKKIRSMSQLKLISLRNYLLITLLGLSTFIMLPKHRFKHEVIRPYKDFYTYAKNLNLRNIASKQTK